MVDHKFSLERCDQIYDNVEQFRKCIPVKFSELTCSQLFSSGKSKKQWDGVDGIQAKTVGGGGLNQPKIFSSEIFQRLAYFTFFGQRRNKW